MKLGLRCGTGRYPLVYPLFLACCAGGLSSLQEKNQVPSRASEVLCRRGKKIAWKLFLSLKSLLVGAGNLQTEGVGVCGGQERPEGGKRKKHLTTESLPGRQEEV